ncbi:MAG: glycosyltransferase family 2 protein [Bacteroidetes bacterium]|nr:glycosyltransferase family 2 protein [Bacteroidota bacterium]
MNEKPSIICLTPTKNEDWILERFLTCASIWADHIILCDQQSTDQTLTIASRFPKVSVIHNNRPDFDETAMRAMLLQEARKISGKKLLVSLDADELLSANWENSTEWTTMMNAAPGTAFGIRIVNFTPDLSQYFTSEAFYPIAYLDDGTTPLGGGKLHSTRLPSYKSIVHLNDIRFLHFSLMDIERTLSKNRWYMCYEKIVNNRNAVSIARQYNHLNFLKNLSTELPLQPPNPKWMEGYKKRGIDLTSFQKQNEYFWDRKVLQYFDQYGTKRFRGLDIWYYDWSKIASHKIRNERRWSDKIITRYFRFSSLKKRYLRFPYKAIDWILNKMNY